MKTTKWIIAGLLAGMLALVGCSKAPKIPDTVEVEGVQVALPALQKSLSGSTDKDVQGSLAKMTYGLRYRDYAVLQAELGKLESNPSLKPDQQKLVSQVQDQVKQVVAKAQAAPTQ